MWAILKERFQHLSPMSTSRKILETAKIILSDCKDIHEYTSAYQEAYDNVCSLTTDDSDLTTKGASMLLQAALLMNTGSEYTGIVSTIESGWKNGETNLENTILRLVKFEAIRKRNAKASEEPVKAIVLLSSSNPPNPGSLRAPKGTCTNQECIEKGITSHFTDHCFLKHPELRTRTKYTLRQIKPRGSKTNLRSGNYTLSTPTTPQGEPSIRET